MNFTKSVWALALSLTVAAIAACGGTDPTPVKAVVGNPEIQMNANVAGALANNTTFSFAGGVPDLGTTSTTTLAFTNTSTTPGISISSDGNTATGDTTFGSCIVTIKTSTYPASHPMATGKVIVLNPCFVGANISGANADSSEALRNVYIQLGSTKSGLQAMPVKISADGTLNVYGRNIGTASVVISGATN